MPKPYSRDLRDRVIGAVVGGMSARAASRLFKVSQSTGVKWVQRWRRTGGAASNPTAGCKRSVLDAHADVVPGLIAERPDLTLEEIRVELGARDIETGLGSVSRFFRRHGISAQESRAGQRAGPP